MFLFGGDPQKKTIKEFQGAVDKINQLEQQFGLFTEQTLADQTIKFKERLRLGETLDNLLPEVFACLREVSRRVLGQRHFDAQLMGGLALHYGRIAEMKTGEGKTLTATLAAYLNALEEKGVHIITVNDYLARRDVNWMGPIFHFLGLRVGCLNHEKSYLFAPAAAPDQNEVTIEMANLKEVTRREAYAADITYGTNNEFGFDYLRDNMAYSSQERSQRDLHFTIVDEIDSILIDEARTPLIISVPDTESNEMYGQFAHLVPRLKENADYNIDEKARTVTLTEEGIEKVEQILGKNIYDYSGIRYVHHLEQALKANTLFRRDKDYVVKDGEIIIVDEFTGRLMPGRRYSEGLHQALEAKEGLRVQKESRTLASITFQNYFRMYKKLAGMTGTAATSSEEFHKVYNLEVAVIPTNKPLVRKELPDVIYRSEREKFKAVADEIKKRCEFGQPVLVGTISIEKNERLSMLLQREGISHQVLNAKQHEAEAQIIAGAGRLKSVTVATNMAGRGVDIILGGRLDDFSSQEIWQKEHDEVTRLGGLHIIGTERHEARRIDNQLRGRAGRQGDPGSSQFFVSLEDDLMRVFGPDKIKGMMDFLKFPEGQPIESKMISRAIESAQSKIEGYNFDLRKHILEYDNVMNKHRETFYGRRRAILEGTDTKALIINFIKEEIQKIAALHAPSDSFENWNLEELGEAGQALFGLSAEGRQQLRDFKRHEEVNEYLINAAEMVYAAKEHQVGADNLRQIEKMLLLQVMDNLWMDHLENMEHLRESVRLRAYGQKDPLAEYKNEGHHLFQEMLGALRSTIVGLIFKVNPAPVYRPANFGGEIKSPLAVNPSGIGRNDPCPCGSGKKYKKCHGA